jgi:3',5'-cyclic AMP phosphodiesterase CpdA
MGWPRQAAWAMAGRPATRVRFAFLTDIHARTEWDTPVAMARMVEAVNAQRPDFVIGGGDFITDGFQSLAETVAPRWDVLLQAMSGIKAPFYPAIGNHDYVAAAPGPGSRASAEPRAQFLERFGLDRTYRVHEIAGMTFFFLDPIQITESRIPYRGWVSNEQLEWVKEELARRSPGKPIVLVTHIPLLSAFNQATEGGTAEVPIHRVVGNNREVIRLFRDHHLVLVLQGHIHVDELIRWRDTTFITGGAVCARWWRGPWYGTEEGFGMVTLGDGRIQWDYIDYGWEARRPKGK